VNSPWKGQASCPAPGEPSYADGGQTAQHGNLIRFRRGGFGYKSCFIRFVNRVNLRVTLVSGAVGCLILGLITVWLWPEKVPLLAASMAGHARLQNRERWYQDSHKPPPTLLEIKTAAENGDAQAQNTLAQVYASQQDFADAVNWYRKAAEQGSTNAQFALGEILLHGRNGTETSATISKDADEAVLWLGKAANQDDAAAQVELGGCYQRGAGVDENLVEAYKWFTLAARQSNTVARVALEHLTLQMKADEALEGEREAGLFVPSKNGELPEPAYLRQLRLKGISASGRKRLAIVNNRTLGESEEASIKLSSKTVEIRCLRIENSSVLVQVGPFRKQLMLAN